MKRSMLALIVILSLASMGMGGTFAGFCDTDQTSGNSIETASLDLKVAKAGDLEYCDDQPWGTGLFLKEIDTDEFEIVPCFKVDAEAEVGFAESYPCNLKLWNASCVHGKVYVHIRDVVAQSEEEENAEGLLTNTYVTIWYDQDNDGEIDEAEVVEGTLQDLACQPVPLEPDVVWLLPAEQFRNLKIVIDPPQGAPGDSLAFDIQFGLIGIFFIDDDDDDMVDVGFCDTEVCLDNYLKVEEE